MGSFARARTRSWISKLWPLTAEKINKETFALERSKELRNKQKSEKNNYLEAIKNGGIWFS